MKRVLGYVQGALGFVQYLAKIFFAIKLNNQETIAKILTKGLLFFNQALVYVFPWDPTFNLADTVKELF